MTDELLFFLMVGEKRKSVVIMQTVHIHVHHLWPAVVIAKPISEHVVFW